MSDNKESILKPVIVGSLILGAAIYYGPMALYDHKINTCINSYIKGNSTLGIKKEEYRDQATGFCINSVVK